MPPNPIPPHYRPPGWPSDRNPFRVVPSDYNPALSVLRTIAERTPFGGGAMAFVHHCNIAPREHLNIHNRRPLETRSLRPSPTREWFLRPSPTRDQISPTVAHSGPGRSDRRPLGTRCLRPSPTRDQIFPTVAHSGPDPSDRRPLGTRPLPTVAHSGPGPPDRRPLGTKSIRPQPTREWFPRPSPIR